MTPPVLEDRRPSFRRLAGFALLLGAVAWGLGAFAAYPWTASAPRAALLRVAFKHVAAFQEAGPARAEADLEKLPRHMRPTSPERARTGRRVPTELRVEVDGRPALARRYLPTGFRHDGPTYGYEEISITPGRRLIEVTLADGPTRGAEAEAGRQWRLRQEVEVPAGRALLIEFSEDDGLLLR